MTQTHIHTNTHMSSGGSIPSPHPSRAAQEAHRGSSHLHGETWRPRRLAPGRGHMPKDRSLVAPQGDHPRERAEGRVPGDPRGPAWLLSRTTSWPHSQPLQGVLPELGRGPHVGEEGGVQRGYPGPALLPHGSGSGREPPSSLGSSWPPGSSHAARQGHSKLVSS